MVSLLLDQIWASLAERGRLLIRLPNGAGPELSAAKLAEELLSERGDASTASRASALVHLYAGLSAIEQHKFHLYLARNFLPEAARLEAAAKAYLLSPGTETAAELALASEPPRQELLRRLNFAPGGTGVLIAMREAVLKALPGFPDLRPLEQDLHHLFLSWFNPGFLKLRRIDWNTPAAVLEKLIAYEAVHEINGWDDLRRRVAADRRCYALFHPALPEDPLIFVEVALCEGLRSDIGSLLTVDEPGEPNDADTALFYSISNCQPGLKKISFGNFLIKQVIDGLRAELPWLKHFATLSPIPGFRRWLAREMERQGEDILLESEGASFGEAPLENFAHALAQCSFETLDPRTHMVKPVLERLCAVYLTASNDGHGPEDPVSRFHLGNGARVERINWCANLTPRGLAESYGMMVNYRYELSQLEVNHERFATEGNVAFSPEIGELMKGSSKVFYRRALARAD